MCHSFGQVALIDLELEPVTLREVLWCDLRSHTKVASTVARRDTNDNVGLVGFKDRLTRERLVQPFKFVSEPQQTDCRESRRSPRRWLQPGHNWRSR